MFVFVFVLFNHHRREHILEKLSRICLFAVVDLGMSTQPGIGTVVEWYPEEVEN